MKLSVSTVTADFPDKTFIVIREDKVGLQTFSTKELPEDLDECTAHFRYDGFHILYYGKSNDLAVIFAMFIYFSVEAAIKPDLVDIPETLRKVNRELRDAAF